MKALMIWACLALGSLAVMAPAQAKAETPQTATFVRYEAKGGGHQHHRHARGWHSGYRHGHHHHRYAHHHHHAHHHQHV